MPLKDDFGHLKIQLKDIRLATNDFRDQPIGKGGFGEVFKGELSFPEGKKTVAFKRLDRRWGQGDTEFWKEIMMLSQYKHENLISLLHFCDEDGERILVYEYASHGSLDCYLGKASLTWNQRLKICHGAACGLNYLHDPTNRLQRVLHRDVKSSNILLDENLTAKISDFGLSKIGPANQQYTYLISKVVGTPGYLDPVYFKTGSLSKESDVYSFGVVLFEVMCGRYCFEYCKGELSILVPFWRKCYEEDKLNDTISNNLKEEMDMDSCKAFSSIAYRCLHEDQKERPTMAEIIKELEIALDHQEMSQDVNERAKHEERIRIANKAATPISYRSRNELRLILSEGILLEGDIRVSINKNGLFQEIIFLNKSNDDSRYARHSDELVVSLTSNFQLQGRTQFLSTNVTYNVNLVYKYWHFYKNNRVPLKYKLHSETKHWTSCVAQERNENMLSIKLYQFTSSQREYDFKIDFMAQLRPIHDNCCIPGRTARVDQHDKRCTLNLVAIEFLPVEYEKDANFEEENKVDIRRPIIDEDTDWKKKLPSDYVDIIKWSKYNMQWTTNKELYYFLRNGFLINKNVEQWFSVSKHKKKRHMLPATAILKEGSIWSSLLGRKSWIWKSLPESRFELVAEFCEADCFTIACEIDSQFLSRGTPYACYLVYKLPEKHFMVSGLIQVDDETIPNYVLDETESWEDNKDAKEHLVDLLTPTHIPFIGCKADESRIPLTTRRIKGHPKLRKDGWMEIQIWDSSFWSPFRRQIYRPTIPMHCRVRTYDKWKLTGLLVQGIEFRPAKVCFERKYIFN